MVNDLANALASDDFKVGLLQTLRRQLLECLLWLSDQVERVVVSGKLEGGCEKSDGVRMRAMYVDFFRQIQFDDNARETIPSSNLW